MKSLWFVTLNYCIGLSLCHVDICQNLTFAVKDENKPTYCIECRICPEEEKIHHYEPCKKKIPQRIPGQGYAWCTADKFPLPYCSSWNVLNGHVNCTGEFSIKSKCTVICNRGYSIVNPQSVECTESLQWNVSEDLRPRCNRTDPPGVPKISSSVLDSKVKAGTTVTLTCKNTTELVGSVHFIWKFNNIDLYNTRTQASYQLGSVKKEDEGSYRCVIKDDLGESLPFEYKLDVENESFNPDEDNKKLLSVLLAIVMISVLFVIICCRKYLKEKILSCFKHKSAKESDSEITSSTDIIDAAKLAQGKESVLEHQVTKYTSGPDNVSKNYSTNPKCPQFKDIAKNCCVKKKRPHSLDSSEALLNNNNKLTETANSNQMALKKLINNPDVMKVIKTCIDQIPDSSNDKPTYRDLAKFLGKEENEILNFEFVCKQYGDSPTEKLLHNMRANGDGIDKFLSFLQRFNFFKDLEQIVQSYNLP